MLGGPDLTQNGGYDAFVTKVNAAGNALVYSGFIGGSGDDRGSAIAVDATGAAYVAGDARSTEANFPVTGGPDPTSNGDQDAFIAKLNPAGTALVFSGFIGGALLEQAFSVALDTQGNAYVSGVTASTQTTFPVLHGPDLTHNGGYDTFVVKIGAPIRNPTTTGVFRPTNGLTFLKNQNTSGVADIQITFGIPGDVPVAGDWDGNDPDTIGVYRNGAFYLRNTNSTGFADLVVPFGLSGDKPIVGDWDSNGTDTVGVYRDGLFLLRNANTSGFADIQFALGQTGDVPITGDWNGDGSQTTGVFRPSNGLIYLKNTNATGFADIQIVFGVPGDVPTAGDWNGDGIDTPGVYRNGFFLLRDSNTTGNADAVFELGQVGDLPISGDWDGLP